MGIDDPDDDKAIRVWHFSDAPAELRALSRHGGDEDWLAVLPPCYGGVAPMWMEEGTQYGCCSVSEHKLPDGRTVVIGAHA
jgi:hypothetical protein